MLNKITLLGNIGHTPQVSNTKAGQKIARLSVATGDSWKDKKTGEQKTKTEWHKIVVLNQNIIKFIENTDLKGKKIYLEGSIITRKYEGRDGQEKRATEIILGQFNSKIELMENMREKQDNEQYNNYR